MTARKITDEQLAAEVSAGLSTRQISEKYHISSRNVQIRKARLAKKGVGHGRDVSGLVPDGYKVKGTSTLTDEYGNTKLQWVKTDVDTSADVYKMVQHGKTTLFFHHGHKCRFDAIEPVMIAKFRKAFGQSEYSYAHVEHLHHQKIVESRNMIVEQHRTLAAKDAYASRGGWMSGRSANVITYSSDFGEVGRLTISPEML